MIFGLTWWQFILVVWGVGMALLVVLGTIYEIWSRHKERTIRAANTIDLDERRRARGQEKR